MIPISRVEMYLAKICGEDVELPIPQTRKEVFLAIIAGESYEKPIPSSRVELYLAKILGDDVPLPLPQSREEIFLAKIAGVEYPLPYPESRIEYWLHKWATYEEWETITGNPVSFTAKAAPLKQLKVAFSPKQDLHGYDSPWPAGGGANKWDGTFNTLIPLEIASGTTVCLQAVLNDTSRYITFRTYDSNQTFLQSMITATVSGNINYGVLTLTSDAAYIRVEKASDITATDGMLSIGNTQPTSFTPYSNICPILGWDSLHVYDDPLYAGVIEWNQIVQIPDGETKYGTATFVAENGIVTVNSSGEGSVGILNASPSPTFVKDHIYLLLGCPSGGGNNLYMLDTGAGIGRDYGSGTIRKYTGETGAKAVTIYIFANYVAHDLVFKPQLFDLTQMFGAGNEPATVEAFKALFPHDYYPYNAGTETLVGTVNGMDTRSISITLGQTVYSGTVDVVTGVGEITWEAKDMGSIAWYYWSGAPVAHTLTADLQGRKKGAYNFMCSSYGVLSSGGYNQLEHGKIVGGSQSASIYVCDERFSDAPTFKTAVAGQYICYELATPIPIQLTPQEVESLAGDNTMWSDANGDLTVEYRSN